jgi:hypothetical protein
MDTWLENFASIHLAMPITQPQFASVLGSNKETDKTPGPTKTPEPEIIADLESRVSRVLQWLGQGTATNLRLGAISLEQVEELELQVQQAGAKLK